MTMPARAERFCVESNKLVYSVTPVRGRPYTIRCPVNVFEEIALTVEETDEKGFAAAELAERSKATWVQTCAVLAFLQELGFINRQRRRYYRAIGYLYLEAMTEYYALAEKGSEAWRE